MKKIKSILSIILILSVVTSSVEALAIASEESNIPAEQIIDDIFKFDVGEFVDKNGDAENSASVDDPDTKLIEFLYTVGVWDNVEKSKSDLLTMTEFSQIMSKVKLGSENALLDVYSRDPDERKVTYKDVFEYLLKATGYYYRCDQFGNSPESMLVVAADIGLIKSNPESINAFVTRGELAKYIKKALEIDLCIMEYTDDGGYRYRVEDNINLLNSVHNIYNRKGFVNAIPGLAVYGGVSLKEGCIQIDRTNLNCNGMDLHKYFGTRVNAYFLYNEEQDERKIIYIEPDAESKILEIDFYDVIQIKNNIITYLDESDTEQEVSVEGFENIVENGKKIDSINDMSNFMSNDGKIILTSAKENDEFDTAIIYKYSYFVVDYNETRQSRIGLKFNQKYDGKSYIQIDDKAINVVTENGTLIDYNNIAVNSAIRLLDNPETGFKNIVSSKEIISGEVLSINGRELQIDNEYYIISSDLLTHIAYCESNTEIDDSDKVKMPKVGDNVTIYVVDGFIAGIYNQAQYKTAVLKNASYERTSIDPAMILRVFTEDSEWADLAFADKLTLNGVEGVSKYDAYTHISDNANICFGELLRYKVNASDEIVYLDTIAESAQEEFIDDDLKCVYDDTVNVDWTKWNIGGTNYLFGKAAHIFLLPEDLNRESEYRILQPSALPEGAYKFRLYNPDKFLQINNLIYRGTMSSSSSTERYYIYIDAIRKVVIDKDNQEYGYKVLGKRFINAGVGNGQCKEVTYYMSEETYNAQLQQGNTLSRGDFVRLKLSNSNIEEWYDNIIPKGDLSQVANGITTYGVFDTHKFEKLIGTIEAVDTENILVLVNCGTKENPALRVCCPRGKAIIDLNQGKATEATISDFHVGDKVGIITNKVHSDFIFKNQ